MRTLLSGFMWAFTEERQSMLVEDGRVVWRLPVDEAPASVEADSRVDLSGKVLLPGFVDAHCHFMPSGLAAGEVDLSDCSTRDEALDVLRAASRDLPDGEWLVAGGYDQNRFADGLHLSSSRLDSVAGPRPVLIKHRNGHAGIASATALAAARFAPGSDQVGADGLLLEAAYNKMLRTVPTPSVERMVEAILAAGDAMTARGITCASDMMTGYSDLERELTAYRLASERGCKVRIRLYVVWSRMLGPRAVAAGRLLEHRAAMDPLRCRIAGVKVFADGALSSRSAAIRSAYEGEKLSHGKTWSGKTNYRQDRLEQMLLTASEAGMQTAIHSLGDHATDCCLSALVLLDNPSMHRLEHAMLLDDAQIERIASLGVPVVQQPEFLVRFGEAYRRSVGSSRASGLNRYRSLLDAGVSLAFSSDRPVVSGDPWVGLRSAVSRPAEFDDSENLTNAEALHAYTAAAADVGGDRGVFGRLEPGEWADYQVYEAGAFRAESPEPEEVRLGSA